MKTLSVLVMSTLLSCINLFAQYDAGTVIYSDTNSIFIQKNYKIIDFDGDGYTDIIMFKTEGLYRYSLLTWFKSDRGESFSEQKSLFDIEGRNEINEFFLGDINKDGTTDIVFQNNDTSFTILKNDGHGNIYEQIDNEVVTEDSLSIDLKQIADMDGDGDIDYIFDNNLIGYNDGSGLISSYEYIDSNIKFSISQVVDIDGDSDMDIIDVDFGSIFIYENLQENGFMLKQEINLDSQEISGSPTLIFSLNLQDIDNDNYYELLVETAKGNFPTGDPHTIFYSNMLQFEVLDYDVQKETFFTLETYDSWLHHGNFLEIDRISTMFNMYRDNIFQIQFGNQNGDNNLDILSVNVPQGKLLWYLGDGKGGFEIDQSQTVHTSSEYSSFVPTAKLVDVDNDGDLDVFVLLNTYTSKTLTLFKNETPVSTGNNNFVFGKMGIKPNPVSGNSYIQLQLPQSQNPINLTYNIFTIKGEKIKSGICKGDRVFITNLANGIYVIEILNYNKRYLKKLIIS